MPDKLSLIVPTMYAKQWQWFWQHNARHLDPVHLIVVATFAPPDTFISADRAWIQIDKPLGFAKTINLGLKSATTPFVATCNDDVQLPENWQHLTASLQPGSHVGATNPILFNAVKQIESAGISVLPIGRAVPHTSMPESTSPFETQAFNGACVVFAQQFLQEVGYFDESFDSYLEDIELSLRGSRLGWKYLVDPQVNVIHLQHQTTQLALGKRKAWLDMRNWWKIILTYTPGRVWTTRGFDILTERARNLSGLVKAYLKS